MLNIFVTIGATLIGVAITGVAGYFIVRGQRITGENEASVTTVTLLSGQIAALTSAQQLASAEMKHLKELLAEKDKQLARNANDIERLQEALTQRAAVEAFRTESRLWFRAIAKATGADEPKTPSD